MLHAAVTTTLTTTTVDRLVSPVTAEGTCDGGGLVAYSTVFRDACLDLVGPLVLRERIVMSKCAPKVLDQPVGRGGTGRAREIHVEMPQHYLLHRYINSA